MPIDPTRRSSNALPTFPVTLSDATRATQATTTAQVTPPTSDVKAGQQGAASFQRVSGLTTPLLPTGAVARNGVSPANLLIRERLATTPAPGASVAAESMATQINTLLHNHTDRGDEARILGLLRSASAADLNDVLGLVDIHEMVEDLDDRVIGPDNRTALMEVLTKERLPELSVATRARFVDAMQRGDTDGLRERAIRDIFLGTTGAELTALKKAIDRGGDHHSMHNLIFHDIDDGAIRTAILTHIKNEAARAPAGQSKVLSDIDDTFYPNWKDDSYPRQTPYPGVIQFYKELDRGPKASADVDGDLGFLTARPGDRSGVMEHSIHSMLTSKGVPESIVLPGDVAHFVGNELIAEKKFDNFREFHQIYPEYGFVMTGDSGQGDVILAEKMAAANPEAVSGLFIHDVVNTPAAKRAEYAQKGIFFFDTYVGAGLEAFKKGLIQKDGLIRIMDTARADFDKVAFSTPAQRDARKAELDRDVSAAKQALGI